MVMTVAAATQRRAILMIRNSIREEKNQRVWLSVLFRRGQGSVGRVALAQRFEMESDIFRFLFQRRFAIQAKGGASEDCRVRPTPTDRQLQSTWISFPGKLFRRGVYMPVISLYHLFCPDWFQWTVPIVLLSLQNLWIVFFFILSRNLFWRGGGGGGLPDFSASVIRSKNHPSRTGIRSQFTDRSRHWKWTVLIGSTPIRFA